MGRVRENKLGLGLDCSPSSNVDISLNEFEFGNMFFPDLGKHLWAEVFMATGAME